MIKKTTEFFYKHYKWTALLLGLISAAGFAPVYAVWATVGTLAAVFFLTDAAQNFRQAAAIGYWYGFGMFAAGFYWIGNALLVDAETFGWLYPIVLLGAGAFFGLFTVIPFMVWHYFSGLWQKVSGFACSWVLLEWIRSFILTGFPWNPLGSVFVFEPMFMQTASLWGVYGLSFLAAFLSGGVYMFLRGHKSGMVVFFCIMLFMAGFGFWRITNFDARPGDIKVRLVQPSIPQQMKWDRQVLEDNFETYIRMSRMQPADEIDFIVWGETAVPFDLDRDWHHLNKIMEAVPPQGYLITGMVRFDGKKAYNSLYVFNPDGGVEGVYDKSHLVPFGEYIPLRNYLPEWIKPVAANVSDFGAGKKYKNIEVAAYPAFGALICYEIIFPGEVTGRTNRPSWLVVLTNDGWYGNSAGPYQHLAAAQMRAVEEGLTIVRSANSGISAVIDPLGRIVGSLPLNAKGFLDVSLPRNLELQTSYGKNKNIYVISFIVLILCVLCIYERLIKQYCAKNS